MNNYKISVCITVLNEEGSVGGLLESLLVQSKKPDEIVIIDGGSSDKTVDVIKNYQKKHKIINLFVSKGTCAHGRNVSIKNAKYDIVALTDAGCIAKKDWLELISKPFKNESVGLVAGFYDMLANSSLQKAMNVFHGVLPSQFDEKHFIPSARSVAFRKSVWKKVGGFSEKLDKAGEDTLFFHKALELGVKIERVKEARVVWVETGELTLTRSAKKFFQYAKGDAQAGIWWDMEKRFASHNIKILAIFIRYIIGILLLMFGLFIPALLVPLIVILILYLLRSFSKVYKITKEFNSGLWGIIVQFTADFSVMAGFTIGLSSKFTKK